MIGQGICSYIEGPVPIAPEIVVSLPLAALSLNAVRADHWETASDHLIVLIYITGCGVGIRVLSIIVIAVSALQELHESFALGVGVLDHKGCC